MEPETKDFLLAEFNASWKMVQDIDNRRGKFIGFCNVYFVAVLGFTANIFSKGEKNLTTAILLSSLFVTAYLVISMVKKIMESERAANVRYRKKINLIREQFLSHIEDSKIVYYMQQKELGIKDFSNDSVTIDKIGRTLKFLFYIINLERIASLVFAVFIWVDLLVKP